VAGSKKVAKMKAMNELRSIADLDQALALRKGKIVLYKHSTQCGMCDGALEEIQEFLKSRAGAGAFYYLDLLAHRDVSNAIAQRLGVKHESPQAIVLEDGKVAAVLNHRAIRVTALEKALSAQLS
jgi:bacillithiol system protein YtxJ